MFSAFTGVGGFELGLPQGWEVIGQSEVDKNANKVLRYRFPGVRNYGDIEKIDHREIPDFDVLVGGSPCQDLSLAGKRKGLVGSKSRLFYSYVNILKEKHPSYFIFENVAGLLSSNQGWDFAEVVSQFSEAGYALWWQVLDAKDFGVPQHRERVFVLGSLGEGGLRKVFLEARNGEQNNGVQGQTSNIITRRYKQSQATGTYIVSKTVTGSYRTRQVDDGNFIVEGQFDAQKETKKIVVHSMMPRSGNPALGGTGHLAKELPYARTIDRNNGQAIELDERIRYLTPLECERLMGWPDNWTKWGIDEKGEVVELSDNARYNLIGNGVVPQVVYAVIDKIMTDDDPDATIAMMEAAY